MKHCASSTCMIRHYVGYAGAKTTIRFITT